MPLLGKHQNKTALTLIMKAKLYGSRSGTWFRVTYNGTRAADITHKWCNNCNDLSFALSLIAYIHIPLHAHMVMYSYVERGLMSHTPPPTAELVCGEGLTGDRVSCFCACHHSVFRAPAIVANRVVRLVVADLHLSVKVSGPVNQTNVSISAGNVAQDSRVLVMATIGISAVRAVVNGRLGTGAREVRGYDVETDARTKQGRVGCEGSYGEEGSGE